MWMLGVALGWRPGGPHMGFMSVLMKYCLLTQRIYISVLFYMFLSCVIPTFLQLAVFMENCVWIFFCVGNIQVWCEFHVSSPILLNLCTERKITCWTLISLLLILYHKKGHSHTSSHRNILSGGCVVTGVDKPEHVTHILKSWNQQKVLRRNFEMT